jgi:hypothetical protein
VGLLLDGVLSAENFQLWYRIKWELEGMQKGKRLRQGQNDKSSFDLISNFLNDILALWLTASTTLA